MAQLPPKIPTNWTNFPPHKAPSMNSFIPTATQPSWIEEFLDFSSAKRGSHRRSVSDSIAFVEPPMVEQCHTSTSRPTHDFDRLDEEQLMSMFSDDIAGGSTPPETAIQHRPPPSPVNSSSNPSTASDRDSINEPSVAAPADSNDKPAAPASERQTAGEPEVQSACELNVQAGAGSPPLTVTADPIIDPKRVKRILANRQSAQRSRVRKLQYISELERSVTSLQTEVSALSPRVAFLDHQRLVLNVDNGALKQRIAALAQDKIFKDAHQEVLRKEIERLRRVYQQQSLNNVNGCK